MWQRVKADLEVKFEQCLRKQKLDRKDSVKALLTQLSEKASQKMMEESTVLYDVGASEVSEKLGASDVQIGMFADL